MGQVDPRTNFEFDVIDKGEYAFVIKETGIDDAKADKKSGKRYWARMVVEDGDEVGKSHMEGFFEVTNNDFSFSKLAGFLLKLGFISTTGKIDTSVFRTPEFEERWKKSIPGLKMGGKISHRTKDKDGKPLDNVQSELKVYYTYAEIKDILAKKGGVQSLGVEKANQPAAQSVQKAPWD